MNGSRNDYADLLTDIGVAQDDRDLRRVCQFFAASLGVTNLRVGVLRVGQGGDTAVSALVETLPLELSVSSLKRRHSNYTPTVLELIDANCPFDSAAPPTRIYTLDFAKIWDEHRHIARCDYFYFVPVIDRGVARGWAEYFGDRAFESQGAKTALDVLTRAAYERMVQLNILPATPSPLTRRQTDALTYCALGKSDWEIGEIMGIAEATAHEHVETAKRRIGVRTRVQAAVVAVQRGWIKP